MKSELSEFYELVDGLETAMMTTRTRDGHLRSRAMANQKAAAGADLWFVTMENSPKLAEIAGDPHVNLSYYRDSSREWVSVSGTAQISRNRDKIHELYAPDWQLWFPKDGDDRHGTRDDPRMVLIGVTVHAAEYLKIDAPRPVILFEMVKGWLTGTEPDLGEVQHVAEPRRRPA
jgi:general stress protein 26